MRKQGLFLCMMQNRDQGGEMFKRLSRTQTIALGFFIIICIGTLLLMLPIASRNGTMTGFHDALFTATSATCVTGLVVADTYQHWSIFGQAVILCLIQIGGLGFITIGMFFSIFLRRKIGLKERNLIQESLNGLQLKGVVRLVKNIVPWTFFFEGVGALILMLRFLPKMGFVDALWYGIFHSVSAFCNGGFDLMGRYEAYSSLVLYYDDIVVNLVIMSLIIIGGIGFIVWDDVSRHKFHVKKYLLHTKIVLVTTAVLIIGGAVLFFLFERENLLADMSIKGQVLSSLFGSVTTRTAGFNTTDTGAYTQATRLLMVVLMFIGGSPGSTAGGIKTTTTVVLLLIVISNLRSKPELNIFGRRLDEDEVKKASTVFLINLFLAIVSVTAICAMQPFSLDDVLFEVGSAIGTVGMTTGITRDLTLASRYIIIILMYCGRIGSMSFALSFLERKKQAAIKFPKERITIG